MLRHLVWLPSLALVAALLCVPPPVSANMASPQQAGQSVGETPGTKAIAIEHELLDIDLRPLSESKPVVVEATYRLRNDAAEQALDLIFVAAALTEGDSGVWLDDEL